VPIGIQSVPIGLESVPIGLESVPIGILFVPNKMLPLPAGLKRNGKRGVPEEKRGSKQDTLNSYPSLKAYKVRDDRCR
jgi:hypothetical protein